MIPYRVGKSPQPNGSVPTGLSSGVICPPAFYLTFESNWQLGRFRFDLWQMMESRDMIEPQAVEKEALLNSLPPRWPDSSMRLQIARHVADTNRCVVALDDDPTGTQTMHDIWVLTEWSVDDLRIALSKGDPALFILTNSRSFPLAQAQALNREVATNLLTAARAENRAISVVSRSDSTLRGHYPGEVDALNDALVQGQGAGYDGVCIIPFFAEGGRFTIGDVHWVQESGLLVPAAQTQYAHDPVFGYHHSRLPLWIEEKTFGKVRASDVLSISLEMLRCGGPAEVARRLGNVRGGQVIVVNAADDRDLEVFVVGLHAAEAKGGRFLFRTAASFVKIAAGLVDKPLLTQLELIEGRPKAGGLIVFGSYVPKSTAQLATLKELKDLEDIELPVAEVLERGSTSNRERAISRTVAGLNEALASGRDALVYTSRELIVGKHPAENLCIGKRISSALTEIVRRIEPEPRYVIGKGGITSFDVAVHGMGVRMARVEGQVLPCVPVWRLGPGSRWPRLPYIVFPGNVGDEHSVAKIVRMLRK